MTKESKSPHSSDNWCNVKHQPQTANCYRLQSSSIAACADQQADTDPQRHVQNKYYYFMRTSNMTNWRSHVCLLLRGIFIDRVAEFCLLKNQNPRILAFPGIPDPTHSYWATFCISLKITIIIHSYHENFDKGTVPESHVSPRTSISSSLNCNTHLPLLTPVRTPSLFGDTLCSSIVVRIAKLHHPPPASSCSLHSSPQSILSFSSISISWLNLPTRRSRECRTMMALLSWHWLEVKAVSVCWVVLFFAARESGTWCIPCMTADNCIIISLLHEIWTLTKQPLHSDSEPSDHTILLRLVQRKWLGEAAAPTTPKWWTSSHVSRSVVPVPRRSMVLQ